MKRFNNYHHKKKCPYVERVHGQEMSLMTEVVQDTENKDLFPFSKGLALKQVENKEQEFKDLHMKH